MREREFDLSSSWNKLEPHLMCFVGANYEAFTLSLVEEDKAKLTHAIEVLPIRLEAMSVANKLKEKFNNRETYIVFINGVDYCIQKGDTSLEIKSSEQLPDFVRRAVGLLKLVEDGIFGNKTEEALMYWVNKKSIDNQSDLNYLNNKINPSIDSFVK